MRFFRKNCDWTKGMMDTPNSLKTVTCRIKYQVVEATSTSYVVVGWDFPVLIEDAKTKTICLSFDKEGDTSRSAYYVLKTEDPNITPRNRYESCWWIASINKPSKRIIIGSLLLIGSFYAGHFFSNSWYEATRYIYTCFCTWCQHGIPTQRIVLKNVAVTSRLSAGDSVIVAQQHHREY